MGMGKPEQRQMVNLQGTSLHFIAPSEPCLFFFVGRSWECPV